LRPQARTQCHCIDILWQGVPIYSTDILFVSSR
jgi:hypothetical protein